MNRQNPIILPFVCLVAAAFLTTGTSLWTTHNRSTRPIRTINSVQFVDNVGYLSRANNPAETSAPYIAANVAIDGIYRERLQRVANGDYGGMTVNSAPDFTMNSLSAPPIALRHWESDVSQFLSSFLKVNVSGTVLSFRMRGSKATVFILFHINGVTGKNQRLLARSKVAAVHTANTLTRLSLGSRYSEERVHKDRWQWRENQWVNISSSLITNRILVDGKPVSLASRSNVHKNATSR